MMTKEEFRISMRKERNILTRDIHMTLSGAIQSRLFQLEEYRNSSLVFIYVSIKKEVDTRKIIDKMLSEGKLVFVPRAEGKHMNFYQLKDMKDLVTSKFGILEPDNSCQYPYIKKDYEAIAGVRLMLIPGLAFDSYGNRIGYGAGYYDRYLTTYSEDSFVKIGLCFGFQVFDEIVYDTYDVKLDRIITPSRVIECNNN